MVLFICYFYKIKTPRNNNNNINEKCDIIRRNFNILIGITIIPVCPFISLQIVWSHITQFPLPAIIGLLLFMCLPQVAFVLILIFVRDFIIKSIKSKQ